MISLLSWPTLPLLRLLLSWARRSAPAGRAARFRFWSREKAEPVLSASIRLSITPSWFPSAVKSTNAFFLAARSARSYSARVKLS